MKSKEDEQQKNIVDRLDSMIYQFIALHDKWSEDRQVTAKQCADITRLIKDFTKQIENLKKLEPMVCHKLSNSIEKTFNEVKNKINDAIDNTATHKVNEAVQQLQKAVEQAAQQLKIHQEQAKSEPIKTVIIAVCCSVIVSLVLVRFVMPPPILPLTDTQLSELKIGHILGKAWNKMSKKEQARMEAMSDLK